MCPGVLVKNTFVCVVDDLDAPSLPSRSARAYHKARSDSGFFPSHLETHSCELLIGSSCDRTSEETPSCNVLTSGRAGCSTEAALLSENGPGEVEHGNVCIAEAEAIDEDRMHAADPENLRIAGWIRSLDAGGRDASAALDEISENVAVMAFHPLGCHVVERALEVASTAEAYRIAAGLRGSVVDAARSQHAHVVLEKIVHYLGSNDTAFVAREIQGWGRAVALNIYGCRVICRLLEFSAQEPLVSALVDEVLAQDTAALCCHKFGHRVAMSIISNASEWQRRRIIAGLRQGGLQRLAKHRFAARVLEHMLSQGCREEARALAVEVMAQPGAVVSLACHSFGVQVARGLLEVPQEEKIARQYLQKAVRKLRKDKYGATLINEYGLQDPEQHVIRAVMMGGA